MNLDLNNKKSKKERNERNKKKENCFTSKKKILLLLMITILFGIYIISHLLNTNKISSAMYHLKHGIKLMLKDLLNLGKVVISLR